MLKKTASKTRLGLTLKMSTLASIKSFFCMVEVRLLYIIETYLSYIIKTINSKKSRYDSRYSSSFKQIDVDGWLNIES